MSDLIAKSVLIVIALLTMLVLPAASMWAAGKIAPLFVKDDEAKRLRFKSPRAAPFSAWTPLMTAKVGIAMLLGFAVLFVAGFVLQQAGLMRHG